MGYIAGVVTQGIEFAERHELNEYVHKARGTHPYLEKAAAKVEDLYNNHATSIVDKLDDKLDGTLAAAQEKKDQAVAAKDQALAAAQGKKDQAFAAAQEKKEQALQFTASTTELITTKKTEAFEAVQAKKTAAFEVVQKKKSETLEVVQKKKAELEARKDAAVEQLKFKVSEKKDSLYEMVGSASLRNRVEDLNAAVKNKADGKGETAQKLANGFVRVTDGAVETADILCGDLRKVVATTLTLPMTLKERWEKQGAPVVQQVKEMPKRALEKFNETRARTLLMIATVTTSALKPLHLDDLRSNFETYVNTENIRAQYAEYSSAMKSSFNAKYESATGFMTSKYASATEFMSAQYTKTTEYANKDALRAQYEKVSAYASEKYSEAQSYATAEKLASMQESAKAQAQTALDAGRKWTVRMQEHDFVLKLKATVASFQKQKEE